ncbi:hypothetical protein C1H46_022688 [Malus baccata]|uniref:PLAT domain-containing protein n=1 Tax=Malus baccata TaxID=106549 RepID=A0A540LZ61_MALBA|nr:hypothetical protein C1H46_022688 [Malus baccata]
MASTNSVNSLFISFLLSLFLTLAFSDDPDCVYTAYVRTGSIIKAGTDSTVNLRLYDAYGYGIEITNLEAWGGLMGHGYNYFERGNLDIFSGRGPCLRSSICALNLTSDGSGPNHGWYVNYVEVTSTGAHVPCNQQLFTIEQWLATDTSPYELTAVRNYCNSDIEGAEKRGRTEHRMIRSGSIGLVSTV